MLPHHRGRRRPLRSAGRRFVEIAISAARSRPAAYAKISNVRELRNQLTRMAALPEAQPLPADPAGEPAAASAPTDLSVPLRVAKQRAVDELERVYIGALLLACGGRVAEVARRAGMDRMSIYRIIDGLKLKV
ncbi:MAG: Response regulator of zinc sigma-54-dependent two-component system [bacterium]|nr:Response regulator of zinc sigma-54-dependent two-component system [bacterium]